MTQVRTRSGRLFESHAEHKQADSAQHVYVTFVQHVAGQMQAKCGCHTRLGFLDPVVHELIDPFLGLFAINGDGEHRIGLQVILVNVLEESW